MKKDERYNKRERNRTILKAVSISTVKKVS